MSSRKSVEISAKNVDLAITQGLASLGATRDDVTIEVLDEGRAGILGLGSRDAVVRITEKETPVSRAVDFLTETTAKMGAPATVEAEYQEDALRINLSGENMGMLIGHHGDTLDALQYLTSLVVNRTSDSYCRVTLDTEGYRDKRAAALAQLAQRTAARAIRIGRVALEPMNPYERRILHTALQDHPRVTTYSEGEEPYRRVIVVRK
jgi:spoIIIJ-associated protein